MNEKERETWDKALRLMNVRTLGVFNAQDELIGKVLISLKQPDALNWDKTKTKGLRGLVV
jgi:hypothetical protein